MTNPTLKANQYRYENIPAGAVFSFEKVISTEDVQHFARLTGDHNPLHVDEAFGKESIFGKNIVHGMLAGSLFSTLVGMHCPGENCLYLSQSLRFRTPLYYGDVITVRGTVVGKNDAIRMITMKTEILREGKVLIDGE